MTVQDTLRLERDRTAASDFAAFRARMEAEGLPEVFIDNFAVYYQRLVDGDDGMIPEAAIRPVAGLPSADDLAARLYEIGKVAADSTVIMKLNGGLGTSMGLRTAKSLLEVKDGLTFLDIIARQALQAGVPLVLMNSYATDAESLAVLEQYPHLSGGMGRSFVQHKEPKICINSLEPVRWPDEPELEWCPPGHGDLYVALVTSGMLPKLLDQGFEYAFISNADNLGAVLDLGILGYMVDRELPFLMEVADRTESDRKGGHLARRSSDGRLVLRELAQCPEQDVVAFQDIGRHQYFNTNNLWLHLPSLQRVLEVQDNRIGLPLIRNTKNVNPRDTSSPKVYQLETAMGAAISIFESADAIRVPRSRFAPVKRTDDLLAVRSDAYELLPDFRIVLTDERHGQPPVVVLDPRHFRLVSEMEARFPDGPPSLKACQRMEVNGDFVFGSGITLQGVVCFSNPDTDPLVVPDGLVVQDSRWPH